MLEGKFYLAKFQERVKALGLTVAKGNTTACFDYVLQSVYYDLVEYLDQRRVTVEEMEFLQDQLLQPIENLEQALKGDAPVAQLVTHSNHLISKLQVALRKSVKLRAEL